MTVTTSSTQIPRVSIPTASKTLEDHPMVRFSSEGPRATALGETFVADVEKGISRTLLCILISNKNTMGLLRRVHGQVSFLKGEVVVDPESA